MDHLVDAGAGGSAVRMGNEVAFDSGAGCAGIPLRRIRSAAMGVLSALTATSIPCKSDISVLTHITECAQNPTLAMTLLNTTNTIVSYRERWTQRIPGMRAKPIPWLTGVKAMKAAMWLRTASPTPNTSHRWNTSRNRSPCAPRRTAPHAHDAATSSTCRPVYPHRHTGGNPYPERRAEATPPRTAAAAIGQRHIRPADRAVLPRGRGRSRR